MKKIPVNINKPVLMYENWSDIKSKTKAISNSVVAASSFLPVSRSVGFNSFDNVVPSISVKESYSNSDYTYFRRGENTNKSQKDIIKDCMRAYKKIGIIRNVIDLMSDFTCQGIIPSHTVPSLDRFVKAWWKKVRGAERSERFVNLLLRAGNTIVYRRTAKITPTNVKKLKKINASPDMSTDIPINLKTTSMEIPWQYTILNPLDVELVGEEVSQFVGVASYILKVPKNITKYLSDKNNDNTSLLLNRLTPDLIKMIKNGAKYIPLPDDKILVYHYKKDDWETWADPIHYCVLDDLIDYQKARLADRTALDAASSYVRIWTLGSLEKDREAIPTQAAFNKLNDMILALRSGGAIDVMWGPDLKVQEISTDLSKFFGPEKYSQTLSNIYAGLGIPSTLTGESGKGFTNNYVSLKTLIERLEYTRSMLTEFWNNELNILQSALKISKPFILTYDRISMTDDASEKALLVQLIDRNLISDEALQGRFDLIPELEEARIRRGYIKRDAGKLPDKAGPYHNANSDMDYKKIALQKGLIRPEDLDIESSMDTKKILNQMASPKPSSGIQPSGKKKGIPQQGRPKNSKDSFKRKSKTVKPRTKAQLVNMITWAKSAQNIISEALTPVYLETLGKKNLRQLSDSESNNFEEFKFTLLANTEPLTKIDDEFIGKLLEQKLEIDKSIRVVYANTLIEFMSKVNSNPTIEDIRNIQAAACITAKIGENNGED